MNAFQEPRFILASASPRRLQLLQQLGFDPICMPVNVDEQPMRSEAPAALVRRLACKKAERCLQLCAESGRYTAGDVLVALGSDTVIDLDGQVLGKPQNRSDGLDMLQRLANREHSVLTGVCVLRISFVSTEPKVEKHEVRVDTRVRFGPVSEEQALAYWNSGEPADKAGGYAIQGSGARFVSRLSGSYSNVVGLPLYETNLLLMKAGLSENSPA